MMLMPSPEVSERSPHKPAKDTSGVEGIRTDARATHLWKTDTPPQTNASPGRIGSVLLIARDREFCRRVATVLAGCGHAVETMHDGENLPDRTLAGCWQAIIVDVPSPGVDGLAILQRIRRMTAVPVLVVSAALSDTDEVAALCAGADSCLEKSGSVCRLVARLQAFTRRAAMFTCARYEAVWHEEIVVAELRVVLQSRTATMGGSDLPLTPSEFAILAALARVKGRVKTRDELYAEIRHREYGASDRALDVQISGLRRKLGDSPRKPRFIRTVRSEGYMLIDPNAT